MSAGHDQQTDQIEPFQKLSNPIRVKAGHMTTSVAWSQT